MTGNLAHSFWLCSKLYTYWKSFFFKFLLYGLWEILGAWSFGTTPLSSTNKYEKWAILFRTVFAKKLIFRAWRSDIAPKYDLWLREMANMLHLERLRLYNEDKGDTFDKMWDPVLQLFQNGFCFQWINSLKFVTVLLFVNRSVTRALSRLIQASTYRGLEEPCPSWRTRLTTCSRTSTLEPLT